MSGNFLQRPIFLFVWGKGIGQKLLSHPAEMDNLTAFVDEKSPAWGILVRRLDFQTQFKLSQQSHHLEEVVRMNAESELRKFQRHIREDKYM